MYLFDFDNTIYDGDSSLDLVLYSLVRHPLLVICSMFKTIYIFILYMFKVKSFNNVKESIFSFLYKIKDLYSYIDVFVLKHNHKIKKWYVSRNKSKDVIISASYDLWIEPFCKSIGAYNVISTKVNKSGKIIGNNCKGKEKVILFKKLYKNVKVKEAYSDSYSDKPMLDLAKKGYIVKKNNIILYK